MKIWRLVQVQEAVTQPAQTAVEFRGCRRPPSSTSRPSKRRVREILHNHKGG